LCTLNVSVHLEKHCLELKWSLNITFSPSRYFCNFQLIIIITIIICIHFRQHIKHNSECISRQISDRFWMKMNMNTIDYWNISTIYLCLQLLSTVELKYKVLNSVFTDLSQKRKLNTNGKQKLKAIILCLWYLA
jgi:hypothetical protein